MSVVTDLLKPDNVADARNVPCPGPILSLKKAITSVEIGQILELQATDKGAHEDVPAWARKTGQLYLGVSAREGYDSHFIQRQK
ncbi:MAG TPA: sulfurtransferase TusA family protein [Capsulimonadaceae bacterium]|jgi:TusA-related sulfurtransferase